MGSLPQIPFPGGPAQGSQGQIYPNAPGTLPYSTTAPSIVEGISSFLQNYTAMRTAEQKRNMDLFQAGVQNMMAGIPIDHKKLAKYAKAAGMPLNFDEPTQPQIEQEKKAQSNAVMQAMLASGAAQVPGPSGGPIQQAALQTPLPQPASAAPQPAAQPSLLSRIGQGLGVSSGPIGPNSPGMQWMDKMQRMGQMNLDQMFGGAEQKQATMNILKAAMQGDPKAVELATRMKLFQTLGPRDELTIMMRRAGMPDEAINEANMYMFMGGPEAKAQVWKMAAEMAPRFGGDMQKALGYVQSVFSGKPTSERPSESFDELYKRGELTYRLQQEYPNAPPQEIHTVATAMTTPGEASQKVAQQLMQHLSQYPSKAGQSFLQWATEMKQKEKFHSENQAVEWSRLAQTKAIHDQEFGLQQLNAARAAAQSEFDNWWKLKEDKDATTEQKDAATVGLVDAMTKKGIKGVTAEKLNGFWGTATLGLVGKTGKSYVNLPAPDFKSPDDMSKYWQKVMNWWTTPPDGFPEDEEDTIWYKKHMMQNMPPQLRP